MGSGQINFSKSHDVGIITLNRPEARNAFNAAMMDELAKALQDCRAPDIRAVLITGSGEAFCAGADVREFANQLEESGPEGISNHLRKVAGRFHKDVILEIRRLEKPVVAGINAVGSLHPPPNLRQTTSPARLHTARPATCQRILAIWQRHSENAILGGLVGEKSLSRGVT